MKAKFYTMINLLKKRPDLFLILACTFLLAAGCGGSNSETSIPSLETELTSLKGKVFSLEESINIMRQKNSGLETKIQTLEKQIYTINANAR